MQYHAIMFMCNDIHRAQWASALFKSHNPDIGLTVYNGGVDDADVRSRLAADRYEAGPNLWHTNTREPGGSFGYPWFEKLFELAEDHDADYTIYLETDVQTNGAITREPAWDMSGVVLDAAPECNLLAYDFWGSYLAGEPFDELWNPTLIRCHTGMGGTALSRNFFVRSRPNLPVLRKAFEMIPYVFYGDLMLTLLGRHSGCTFGDWEEVSGTTGTGRWDPSAGTFVLHPFDPDATLVHGIKL